MARIPFTLRIETEVIDDPAEGQPGEVVDGKFHPSEWSAAKFASACVPDWEEDSLRPSDNLVAALKLAACAAERREIPTLTAARNWHKSINRGLVSTRTRFVGAFRGEPGLERTT